MLGQTLAFFLSATALTLGSPITDSVQPVLHKRITQCSGIPGGIFFNNTELSDTTETIVRFSYPETVLSGVFFYNGHGGAPCDPSVRIIRHLYPVRRSYFSILLQFALGLSRSETAPTNVVDAGWVDRVAIGGNQANELALDSHVISDHYNVFFVQYDPATGDVLADPSTQSVAKICYRGTYPLQDNPCDA